jgi:hypothetical protein
MGFNRRIDAGASTRMVLFLARIRQLLVVPEFPTSAIQLLTSFSISLEPQNDESDLSVALA